MFTYALVSLERSFGVVLEISLAISVFAVALAYSGTSFVVRVVVSYPATPAFATIAFHVVVPISVYVAIVADHLATVVTTVSPCAGDVVQLASDPPTPRKCVVSAPVVLYANLVAAVVFHVATVTLDTYVAYVVAVVSVVSQAIVGQTIVV